MTAPPQALPSVPKVNEIGPITESAVRLSRQFREHILAAVQPDTATFARVIQPRAQIWNEFKEKLGMVWVLGYASPDSDVHKEVDKARKLVREVLAEWKSSDAWFRLVQAVADRDEVLDAEDKMWLEDELKSYTRYGHGVLSDMEIKKYLDMGNKIGAMKDDFARNLRTESGGLWFTPEELEGVPAMHLDSWQRSDEFPGKIFVPFANDGRNIVLTHANDNETRKRMYLADNKRAPANITLFREVIIARDAQARMLGYPSHAAFAIERRAAKSAEWVSGFLSKLQEDLVPRGAEELNVLKERRRMHLQGQGIALPDEKFPPWDYNYYQRLMENEVSVDKSKISEFFPLEYTAPAMLDIFATVLRLRFRRIPQDELDDKVIWHDSVHIYSVWDEGHQAPSFVGYLYFDLAWRENKYRGCQNVTIEEVSASSHRTRSKISETHASPGISPS